MDIHSLLERRGSSSGDDSNTSHTSMDSKPRQDPPDLDPLPPITIKSSPRLPPLGPPFATITPSQHAAIDQSQHAVQASIHHSGYQHQPSYVHIPSSNGYRSYLASSLPTPKHGQSNSLLLLNGNNNKRFAPPHVSESPAKKKQSKWTADEDASIIELRGSNMKWEDISKHLPGRSAISCRLRFQNYLERRSEWDEEKKNKLARLYERFKKDMWEKISKEMQLPWRAAEAMHWQIGEIEMAQRANVPVFHLAGQPLPVSTTGGPGPDYRSDSVSPTTVYAAPIRNAYSYTHSHSMPQISSRSSELRRTSTGESSDGFSSLSSRADSAPAFTTGAYPAILKDDQAWRVTGDGLDIWWEGIQRESPSRLVFNILVITPKKDDLHVSTSVATTNPVNGQLDYDGNSELTLSYLPPPLRPLPYHPSCW
nr:transforming protein myb [Quercus suber]